MQNLSEILPVSPNNILDLVTKDRLYDILTVACKLNLFGYLVEGKSISKLAKENGWEEITTGYFLDVLHQAGYLEKREGTYRNTALADTYLLSQSFLEVTHFFPKETAPLSLADRLTKALERNDEILTMSPEPKWNPHRLRQIGVGALVGSLSSTINACDLKGAKRLLDLGGGHGFYTIAFMQKYPHLQGTLMDLPQIVPLAQEFIKQFDLEERIHCLEGDFLQDEIGINYDAVLCSNILHSDKRDNVLNKVWQALNPGGQIIVKCRVKDCTNNLENAIDKLLWYIQGGKEIFSQAEWANFLEEKGFRQIRTVDLNGIFATIIGWKNK